MEELSIDRKLANLKLSYEAWDWEEVTPDDFVRLYLEVARKLRAEREEASDGMGVIQPG